MKKMLVCVGMVLLLSGCEVNPLSDEQVKMVAESCKAKGMSLKVVNNQKESSAYCVHE